MKKLLADLNELEMRVKNTLYEIKDNFEELQAEQNKIDLAVMNIEKTCIKDTTKAEVLKLIKNDFSSKLGVEEVYKCLKPISDRILDYTMGKEEIEPLKEVPHSKLQEAHDICSKMQKLVLCRVLRLNNIVICLETMAQVLEEFNDSIDKLYQ